MTAGNIIVLIAVLVVAAILYQALVIGPPTYSDIYPYLEWFPEVWLALLVITAALSAYTGWQYLRPKR